MIRLIRILVLACLPFVIFAIPERPNPPRLVNDFANVLSSAEENQLEQKVLELFKATSTQIAVVTVKDLEGAAISSYAFELGEKWGVGNEKFNNGVVVLLKPKTSSSKGEVFIATGYGLEGAVPDIIADRIVEQEMIPWFKKGSYYGGINAGVDVLIGLAKGEYSAQQYAKKPLSKNKKRGWGLLPLIIVFIIFRLFSRRSVGLGHALPWWFLFSSMGSSSHRGTFNDFSNSSGKFGGGDFGGFGGFGGGGFGGGGAGGSW